VKLDRKCDRALRNLGRIYYRQGFIEAAAKVYRDWLAADPGNPTATHFLAGCGEGEIPDRASDAYLTSEFDEFAETFEKTLGLLGYRAPELCRDVAAALLPEPSADLAVLDAGCGTGLVGPLLRPFAKTLTGIDLSPKMLEAAAAKECYDELIHGEITAFLETGRTFDLIAAADTLIYFGGLDRLLAAVRDALTPSGLFVFSVEADDDTQTWSLGPHGRYRHGEAYLRDRLESAGLAIRSFERDWIRRERQIRVFGYVVAAGRE
jgi:predicted TPR repeat methyltransferase